MTKRLQKNRMGYPIEFCKICKRTKPKGVHEHH